jgi:uncharacterized protein YbcI
LPKAHEEPRPDSAHLAISNAVVRLFAESTGRGPTQARTVIGTDLVAVVLRDSLTKGERALMGAGHGEMVRDMRLRIQDVIRKDAIAAVEDITGRTVLAMLSDHEVDSDVAIEAFVLEPEQ